jgi:hypothetical protein
MRNVVVILVMLLMSVIVHGQMRTVSFEQDMVGRSPEGFVFGHTRKVGAPGRWIVQQDGADHYLAQLDADRTINRFPLAVLTDVSAVDIDLSVRFRPVSGRVDQAAGLVWRRPVEHTADRDTRSTIRSALQRANTLRGRGHYVHSSRASRRLDEGRLRHALR